MQLDSVSSMPQLPEYGHNELFHTVNTTYDARM